MIGCKLCNFKESWTAWTIRMYQQPSRKHKGKKQYVLNIVYPPGGLYPVIEDLEVYYCPVCGRKLGESND